MKLISKFNRYINKISPYKDFANINKNVVLEHYMAGYRQAIKDLKQK